MVAVELRPREEEQRRAEDRRQQSLAERAQRPDYLLRVSPRKFEEHFGEMFAALGYNVRVTPISSDEGVDAYLEKGGRRAIVQCKRYTSGKVSRPDVQRLFGVLSHKRVDEAFLVATVEFSKQAVEFARGKPIHLVDLDMMIEMSQGAFSEDYVRSGPSGRITGPHSRRR